MSGCLMRINAKTQSSRRAPLNFEACGPSEHEKSRKVRSLSDQIGACAEFSHGPHKFRESRPIAKGGPNADFPSLPLRQARSPLHI